MLEAVANTAAGQTGRANLEDVERRLRETLGDRLGSFIVAEPKDIEGTLRAAAARKPEGLIVFGGDGTARAAAEIVGRAGIPIAPLPGGTMNILPKKVFGDVSLNDAISTLGHTEEKYLPGGEIGGRLFFLSAALGFAGSLARLRETQRGAFRPFALAKEWTSCSSAFTRSLAHGVQWRIGRRRWQRAHTLVLAVGSVNSVAHPEQANDNEEGFEIASLDLKKSSDIAHLGFHAIAGSWRDAPMVEIEESKRVELDAPSRRPLVVLDGEPIRVPGLKDARWLAEACPIMSPMPIA